MPHDGSRGAYTTGFVRVAIGLIPRPRESAGAVRQNQIEKGPYSMHVKKSRVNLTWCAWKAARKAVNVLKNFGDEDDEMS